MTKLQDCVRFLSGHGYAVRGTSVESGRSYVEFDKVMVGGEDHSELVLIQKDDAAELRTTLKKIKLLTLLLENAASLRTFTLVVIADYASRDAINELDGYARTIVVCTAVSVKQRLLPLIPFEMPPKIRPGFGAEHELEKELGSHGDDQLIRQFIEAARQSADVVEAVLLEEIESVLSEEAGQK